MLFAYNEDGTLQVVADITEARRHFEPQDVESGAIQLFDDEGKPLTPVFPHRTDRKVFGMRVDSDPGPYDLVAEDSGASGSLSAVLEEANVLMPNRWFADLSAIRQHIARS